jgi:nicotinamide-nucleotide amidase
MDAEIITIGDEIITGHTIDTNGAFIAASLLTIGLNIRFRTSVGDTPEDMEEAFQLALKRAQVVITTGGLGPTDDDITKRSIVKVFKRNLIFHEDILEDIKARYLQRGVEMPAINQNQALLPQGATLFPNATGSAVGICINERGKIFISLPGVPGEMEQILTDEVLPYLRERIRDDAFSVTKLRTTGIIESRLHELIKPNLKPEPGVKLAYLPSYSGVDLRVIARARTQAEADEKKHTLVRYLEATVGKYIYGRDLDTQVSVVGRLLVDNDKTLAVAESCTAGLIGAAMTSIPGSSAYFIGGILAYSDEVKIAELGVARETIEQHGAVSEATALEMALCCRRKFGSDYALAVTGIAGPDGGTESKPVGTVWIGLASAHNTIGRLFPLGGQREVVRQRAVACAIELLRREILDIT